MRRNACHITTVAIAVSMIAANLSDAGDICCALCGCSKPCQKTCRLVCEEQEIEITCWGCKREDFCVPGPSKPGCRHCEMVCGKCEEEDDQNAPYSKAKRFVWTYWMPSRASVHSRKKLMKKTVTKTVPGYKWVVEDLCEYCATTCTSVDVEPGASVQPPPVDVDAQVIYPRTIVAFDVKSLSRRLGAESVRRPPIEFNADVPQSLGLDLQP
jgi:hypothetical protein